MEQHCTFSPMYEPAHLPINTLFTIVLVKEAQICFYYFQSILYFYCTSLLTVFACIDTTILIACSFYRSVTCPPQFPFLRSLVTEYDLLLSLCLCTVDVDLN